MLRLTSLLVLAFILAVGMPVWADLAAAEKEYEKGNPIGAIVELRPLAEQGDDRAQFMLGKMYARGEGVAKDLAEAYYWCTKAAKTTRFESDRQDMNAYIKGFAGNMTPEQVSQAKARLEGKKPEKKPLTVKEQMDLIQMSMQAGNYTDGMRDLTALADKGEMPAIMKLAEMYRKGEGTEADFSEAMKWYKKAAEKGNGEADGAIGTMYAAGQGVPADEIEAANWIHRAAEKGAPRYQAALAGLYLNGKGVDANQEEAYFWAVLAATEGNEEGEQIMVSLNQVLPPEKISAIKQKVSEWKPKTN